MSSAAKEAFERAGVDPAPGYVLLKKNSFLAVKGFLAWRDETRKASEQRMTRTKTRGLAAHRLPVQKEWKRQQGKLYSSFLPRTKKLEFPFRIVAKTTGNLSVEAVVHGWDGRRGVFQLLSQVERDRNDAKKRKRSKADRNVVLASGSVLFSCAGMALDSAVFPCYSSKSSSVFRDIALSVWRLPGDNSPCLSVVLASMEKNGKLAPLDESVVEMCIGPNRAPLQACPFGRPDLYLERGVSQRFLNTLSDQRDAFEIKSDD